MIDLIIRLNICIEHIEKRNYYKNGLNRQKYHIVNFFNI